MKPYRYKISLRMTHPVLDPDQITTALGRSPRRSWRSGESRRTPTGVPLEGTNDVSYWTSYLIDSEEKALGDYLEDGLAECVGFLEGHQDFLAEFIATGGTIALRVGWFLNKSSGGEFLGRDLLKRLGRLEVDLILDVYEKST